MQKYLIGSFVIAIIAVTFALQNSIPVPITLWFWDLEGSLALIILLTLMIGALLGIMVSWAGNRRKRRNTEDTADDTEME